MLFEKTGEFPALAEEGADLFRGSVGILGAEGAEGDAAGVFEETGGGEELFFRRGAAGAKNLLDEECVGELGGRFHGGIVTKRCGASKALSAFDPGNQGNRKLVITAKCGDIVRREPREGAPLGHALEAIFAGDAAFEIGKEFLSEPALTASRA